MSPGNGKGRPRQGDPIPNSVQNLGDTEGTPPDRRKLPPTPVVATAVGVIGGTGRFRWLLLFRCPACGRQHVAHGRGMDLPASLERPAACGRGRLTILPAVGGRLAGAA